MMFVGISNRFPFTNAAFALQVYEFLENGFKNNDVYQHRCSMNMYVTMLLSNNIEQ